MQMSDLKIGFFSFLVIISRRIYRKPLVVIHFVMSVDYFGGGTVAEQSVEQNGQNEFCPHHPSKLPGRFGRILISLSICSQSVGRILIGRDKVNEKRSPGEFFFARDFKTFGTEPAKRAIILSLGRTS